MKLPIYLLVLLLVLVAGPIHAQQSSSKCYTTLREKGNQNFSAGRYTDAIKNWESAKKCPDKPASNDLQTLINKAQAKLNTPPPDRDGDGVPDSRDSCPSERGPASNNGCPVPPPDRDGDGVPDSRDSCPSERGPASNNGCPVPPPDRDGDGVPDSRDSCPGERGPASNNGCPVPTSVPTYSMVRVSGGTFTMGCTNEQRSCDSDEKPTHQVTLSDFYISKYEVTQKEWQDVMGSNPSSFKNCDNCPVENVSWNDIQDFLTRLKAKTGVAYRLPTEAEWEYAARGGASSRGYQYAGSNTLGEVAWYDDNASSKTHPVGQKKPNELGLYDMSGNVWEWCSDWKGTYASAAQTNPQGSSTGSFRVERGGSWSSYAEVCRVAIRGFSTPDYRLFNLGFRLARTP